MIPSDAGRYTEQKNKQFIPRTSTPTGIVRLAPKLSRAAPRSATDEVFVVIDAQNRR